jgi:hypothetical protein
LAVDSGEGGDSDPPPALPSSFACIEANLRNAKPNQSCRPDKACCSMQTPTPDYLANEFVPLSTTKSIHLDFGV